MLRRAAPQRQQSQTLILNRGCIGSQHARMTSLISWIGVDSRGASSAYIASDSRITWSGGRAWDHARKLFACRQRPHIFGYCGDVVPPTHSLSQLTELIDSGLGPGGSQNIDTYAEYVTSILDSAFRTYPMTAKAKFEVLYCMRDGEGMTSRFHLRHITFSPDAATSIASVQMPPHSDIIAVLGSGSGGVRQSLNKWKASDVGGTSRAVFSAFCDALRSGDDQQSGGPPQLMGLRRKSAPHTFGIVWKQHRYFYGTGVDKAASPPGVQWFNERFEICDPATLVRRQHAQPQPRPAGI